VWLPGLHRLIGRRVYRAFTRGDPAAAERIASRFRRYRPGDPMSWVHLARVLIRTSKARDAEPLVRTGLRIHPDSLALWVELANSLNRLKRHEEERELWQELIRRFPESSEPYAGLALRDVEDAHYEDSKRAIDAALLRNPPPLVLAKLAYLLLFVPDERARAEDLFERSATLSNDSVSHVFAGLLLEAQDPRRAAEHLRLARKHWEWPSSELSEMINRARITVANLPSSEAE